MKPQQQQQQQQQAEQQQAEQEVTEDEMKVGGARVKASKVVLDAQIKADASVALVQFDDRVASLDKAFGELMKRNEEYCKMRGYQYLFYDQYVPPGHNDGYDVKATAVSPYWVKVLLARDLLDAGYEYVMWVDTDAAVNQRWIGVPELFRSECKRHSKPDAVLVISEDPPEGHNGPFNTGAWIAKKGTHTRAFFDAWLSHYDTSEWKQSSKGKWTCTQNGKKCPWAGLSYEQGSLSLLDQRLIARLPWNVMANFDYTMMDEKTSFVLHFMGDYRNRMYTYLDIVLRNKRPTKKRQREDLHMELDRLVECIDRAHKKRLSASDKLFLPNAQAIQSWVDKMLKRIKELQTALKRLGS